MKMKVTYDKSVIITILWHAILYKRGKNESSLLSVQVGCSVSYQVLINMLLCFFSKAILMYKYYKVKGKIYSSQQCCSVGTPTCH